MKRKKLLLILLCVAMLLTMIPAFSITASAATKTVNSMEELKAALEASGSMSIVIGKDLDLKIKGSEAYWCKVNGYKTLDLAGHEVVLHNDDTSVLYQTMFCIESKSFMTVNDSEGDGRITFLGYLNDKGTLNQRDIFRVLKDAGLTVNGGFIDAGRSSKKWYASKARYLYRQTFGNAILAAGSLTITGGKFNGRGAGSLDWPEFMECAALRIEGSASVNIYGGEFYGYGAASCIYKNSNASDATISIAGGRFKTDSVNAVMINGTGYNYFNKQRTGVTKSMIDENCAKITKSDSDSVIAATELVITPLDTAIKTSALDSGKVGVSYSGRLYAQGPKPYTWSIYESKLPAGLSLNSSTGIISGKPAESGSFSFKVKCESPNGNYAIRNFSLIIADTDVEPAMSSETVNMKVGTAVEALSLNYDDHNYESYSLMKAAGNLPEGINWRSNMEGIYFTGTPKEPGSYSAIFKIVQGDDYSVLYHTVNINVSEVDKKIDKIDISAEWNEDCTGLKDVVLMTEGCKLTGVAYSMFKKTIDSLEPGNNAAVGFTIKANDGYVLSDSVYSVWNGKTNDVIVADSDSNSKRFVYELTVPYPEGGIKISEAKVYLDAPIAGKVLTEATISAPDSSSGSGAAKTKFATAKYSVLETKWYAGGVETAVGSVAKSGTAYEAVVTLTPYEKYAFTEATVAKLNNQSAVVESADQDSLVLKYKFDKTQGSDDSTKDDNKKDDSSYVFPFIDVKTSDWFYDSVMSANKMGLIDGIDAEHFNPTANMTYCQAVKLAACMHQLNKDGSVTLKNSADGSPWYKSYYDYCLAEGIILKNNTATEPGYGDLYADANKLITRQMYVYIFSRSLPESEFAEINNIPDNAIPDVSITQGVWDDGIYLFYRAGICNGNDKYGTFNPENNIKRSEVAAILIRMMDKSKRVGAPENM